VDQLYLLHLLHLEIFEDHGQFLVYRIQLIQRGNLQIVQFDRHISCLLLDMYYIFSILITSVIRDSFTFIVTIISVVVIVLTWLVLLYRLIILIIIIVWWISVIFLFHHHNNFFSRLSICNFLQECFPDFIAFWKSFVLLIGIVTIVDAVTSKKS
jgi:hypothetical protein